MKNKEYLVPKITLPYGFPPFLDLLQSKITDEICSAIHVLLREES